MEKNLKEKIYEEISNQWDFNKQAMMVAEECGELVVALSHYTRGRGHSVEVIEELADVSIMIEQMVYRFGDELFEDFKKRKLERLADKLLIDLYE